MQQRKWLALGQALKALRTDRDIGQKTIIDRSGEALVERTLRIYESGQQRPSRDRLLKFLTRSFEVTNVPEVNRYLELSGYALLSGGEILQLGLGEHPDMRRGKPADFRVEVSTLIVTDGQGQELWRHQFSSRFELGAYDSRMRSSAAPSRISIRTVEWKPCSSMCLWSSARSAPRFSALLRTEPQVAV